MWVEFGTNFWTQIIEIYCLKYIKLRQFYVHKNIKKCEICINMLKTAQICTFPQVWGNKQKYINSNFVFNFTI